MSFPSALVPLQELFQDRVLAREFLDTLLPDFFWDAVTPEARQWNAHAGLSLVVTADGQYRVSPTPSSTSSDPTPTKRRAEQWGLSLFHYSDTDDIEAVSAANMLSDYAVQTVKRLAEQAAGTMDAAARASYLNAAVAGWTVADGTQPSNTTIKVKRLVGFTEALQPNAVLHSVVSPSNPLKVYVNGAPNEVIGYIADQVIATEVGQAVDDLVGPGSLQLRNAVAVTDRDPIVAENASVVQRSGGGINMKTGRIDDVKAPISYADIRVVRSRAKRFNVKPMRRYNGLVLCQISPTAYAQLQGDPEFQRLQQGRGVEDFPYAAGTIGSYAGVLFLENSNAPSGDTVHWRDVNGSDTPETYGKENKFGYPNASTDAIGIETCIAGDSARPVDHTTFYFDDCAAQYYQPHPLRLGAAMLTDIGVSGVVAEPYNVINDGVMIPVEYVDILIRSPNNRKMDKFPATWQSNRCWVPRRDQISRQGGPSKFKRILTVQSSAVSV